MCECDKNALMGFHSVFVLVAMLRMSDDHVPPELNKVPLSSTENLITSWEDCRVYGRLGVGCCSCSNVNMAELNMVESSPTCTVLFLSR